MAKLLHRGISTPATGGALTAEANVRDLIFELIFDLPVHDSEEALRLGGVPDVGSVYPYNDSLRASSIDLKATVNETHWRVKVRYDATSIVVREGYGYDFMPSLVTYSRTASGCYYWEVVDADGQVISEADEELETPAYPIVMSTGNPPAEGIEIEESRILYEFWQVESRAMTDIIENGEIQKFVNTINRNDVVICGVTVPAYHAIIKAIKPVLYFYRPTGATESEKRYKTTYTIEIRDQRITVDAVDQDFQALLYPVGESSGDELLRDIRVADLPENEGVIDSGSEDDDVVQDPVRLDGEGRLLDIDNYPTVYNVYQVNRSVDWNNYLNIAKENSTRLV